MLFEILFLLALIYVMVRVFLYTTPSIERCIEWTRKRELHVVKNWTSPGNVPMVMLTNGFCYIKYQCIQKEGLETEEAAFGFPHGLFSMDLLTMRWVDNKILHWYPGSEKPEFPLIPITFKEKAQAGEILRMIHVALQEERRKAAR